MIRDSNKMKYYFFFFFCLDAGDTKKKMKYANIEKHKRNTKKTKITEGYDFVSELSSNTNWYKPHDHAT